MRIVFRVDGGYRIGMGHIARCVTLAKYIRSVSDTKILFVTKDFKPGIDWIKQGRFPLYRLSQEADLRSDTRTTLALLKKEGRSVLITDIPGANERYLEYLSNNKNESKLICFDSYGIKKMIPDILINPTLIKEWYPPWKNDGDRCFLGSTYWILDKSYGYYYSKTKEIKRVAKDILISFGGTDTADLTMKILKSMLALNEDLRITIVIGPAFKKFRRQRSLFNRSGQKKIIIKEKVHNLAKLIYEADIGIISGGFTLYEAAYIGLPCLVICKVLHQLKTAHKFKELGIARIMGSVDKFDSDIFQKELERLIHSQTTREKMSKNGKRLLDGKGAERVWRIIKNSMV